MLLMQSVSSTSDSEDDPKGSRDGPMESRTTEELPKALSAEELGACAHPVS